MGSRIIPGRVRVSTVQLEPFFCLFVESLVSALYTHVAEGQEAFFYIFSNRSVFNSHGMTYGVDTQRRTARYACLLTLAALSAAELHLTLWVYVYGTIAQAVRYGAPHGGVISTRKPCATTLVYRVHTFVIHGAWGSSFVPDVLFMIQTPRCTSLCMYPQLVSSTTVAYE